MPFGPLRQVVTQRNQLGHILLTVPWLIRVRVRIKLSREGVSQVWQVMDNVRGRLERNLWRIRQLVSNQDSGWGWIDVSAELIADIADMPIAIKRVRIHDSGDFYHEQYLRTWIDVARHHRSLIFYGYTKMIKLWHQALKERIVPDNLLLVQSFGGTEDQHIDLDMSHSRVFPTIDALEAANYVNASDSDWAAYTGQTNIGLVYHGNRKLSDHQVHMLNLTNMMP